MRHAGLHLLLGEPFGERHLDRAIERQFAPWTRSEHLHRGFQREERPQQVAAESFAGEFDFLGEADFFVPGEQRDLRHLREIHPDRIARSVRHAVGENEPAVAVGGVRFLLGQFAAMGVRAIDQFDSQAVDRAEHGVDAVGALDFIGQQGADFFVSELAVGLWPS